MIGARFGALVLALVLVFTGCSKPSRNLLSPAGSAPGPRLAGSASYRIPARIDPDTATLAFGTSLSVHALLDAVIPASADTSRSRVFLWVTEPSWIAVDSSLTLLPATTLRLTGPGDERSLSASLRMFAVDTVRYTRLDSIHVSGGDTVRFTSRRTVLDTVATAHVGVGLIRRARPDVASVDVIFDNPTDTLVFGAGIDIHAQAHTSGGANTGNSAWHYYWSTEPEIIQLAAPAVTGDPRSSLVVLGTNDLNIKQMPVNVAVVRDDTVWARVADKWAFTVQAIDTLATGSRMVVFKRAVNRDVTADFWVYHVTKSLGGSVATSQDSAVAQFVNNDADHNLLRAGKLSVSGTDLLEYHLPVGQHYSGPILFKIPGTFEIHNTGPASDGNSHVPQLNFSTQGPPNELTLTFPNDRGQVGRDHELELQWSGGLGNSLVPIRVEQPLIGRRDTVRVGVELQLRLTDSAGKRFLVQTLDSGRFTMSAAQVAVMAPGIVEVVLTRKINVPVLTVAAATEVSSTVHLIEENHSWFFLK